MKPLSVKKLSLLFSVLILKYFRNPKRTIHQENFHTADSVASKSEHHKLQVLGQRQDLENKFLIFNVETSLLRSSSLFPYFLLVAFEAGSPIRAFIFLILYPFIILCRDDLALKLMVIICFFGLSKERFREGRAVLPKFFLENVGRESFEVLRRGKKTVGVSNLPQVMVQSFLRDLDIDYVVGKDLKVFCGYFVGLMEERRELIVPDNVLHNAVGVSGCKKYFDCPWFAHCKELYLVNEQERRNWHQLPRNSYPKPLIFHDGRLAFRPSFLAALAMFMWLPLGFTLGIIRTLIALTLPFDIAVPLLHFIGIKIRVSNPNCLSTSSSNRKDGKPKRRLYVCNHKTLLDPIVVSYATRSTTLTAVTYSLSRMSEIISPIKTVRLTRHKDQDAELMHKLLSQSDLVVCPEGTTCREPYLLRFSPLFSEISNEVFPVAVNCHNSMFYGTTARGFKFLDPLFFLMNPWPSYSACFLGVVRRGDGDGDGGDSRFQVADSVQSEIGKALGFTCTKLTRKDKYLILAGNDGVVRDGSRRT
ncbi:putative glycerol-3-phosphate acyltransferase 3 [Sesamum angolense]|uniref:Glycerol-3-phosphate acyltransferase 3 n=1 Tax=Sesamum angolense TaxID=2727404 RepID=A0AAE1WEQ0_9LAMI|nr:putative glycerol-3-phosphate acyltransferase 3 [Sesamum angolense]